MVGLLDIYSGVCIDVIVNGVYRPVQLGVFRFVNDWNT